MLEQSQTTFEAGLKRFPEDAMHRQAYGVLLVKLAEGGAATEAKAVEMLQSAVRLDPTLGPVRAAGGVAERERLVVAAGLGERGQHVGVDARPATPDQVLRGSSKSKETFSEDTLVNY